MKIPAYRTGGIFFVTVIFTFGISGSAHTAIFDPPAKKCVARISHSRFKIMLGAAAEIYWRAAAVHNTQMTMILVWVKSFGIIVRHIRGTRPVIRHTVIHA